MHDYHLYPLPALLRAAFPQAPILHFTHVRFPHVDLVLDAIALDEQVAALVERRIDVSLLRGPVSDDRIVTVPILREYYCVAVPVAHRFARAPFVRLADTSHFAHVDSPDRLLDVVMPFLGAS